MFKKFTFEKKLGVDSREPKWRGLKIVTVSGLLAFLGGAFAAVGFGGLGYWLVLLGVAGVGIGMIMHFFALVTEILQRKR
ncbi:hypothetical protein [Thioalbus denitrificans]|uniref:hypothetical protein n=1 Tax=Thioalbus denitrificans TaxID=547122 RepID=UPI0011C04AC3|nr:hypothetical protein [Thioalbus denitrificans]